MAQGPVKWDGLNARLLVTGTLLKYDGTPIGSSANSFSTWQCPSGTNPTAASSTDTMTLTSSDSNVVISGNAGTDTIDYSLASTIGGTHKFSGAISFSRPLATNDALQLFTNDGTFAGTATGSIGFSPDDGSHGTRCNFYSDTGHYFVYWNHGAANIRSQWILNNTCALEIDGANFTNNQQLMLLRSTNGAQAAKYFSCDDGAITYFSVDSTGKVNSRSLTASTAIVTDASKNLISSSTTSTELAFVHGVLSQLSGNTDTATLTNKTLNGYQTNINTSTKTGNYAVLTTDVVVQGDATGGVFTLTLPTAVGVAGQIYTLKKIVGDTSFNAITIATTSAQTIDGAASFKLQTFGETLQVQSDGSNWIIIHQYFPSTWTSYTPTWTSAGTAPALGNGSIGGMWCRVPGGAYFRVSLESGTTTTFGNNSNGWTFSTPTNLPNMDLTKLPSPQTEMKLGTAMATVDNSGSFVGWGGEVRYQSGTTVKIQNTAGQALNDFCSTIPAAWTAAGANRLYLEWFAPITGWN